MIRLDQIRKAPSGAAAAFVVALAASASPAAAKTIDMKLGFITIHDSQHESAKYFAAEIAKRTHGAIKARIFPAGQLGKIGRQIEGLQLGTQEVFYTPPGFMVGINQAFQAADAPGLFDSAWHHYKTLNHPLVRDKFLGLAERANIVGIYSWSAGNTGIATRRKITAIDGVKGLKLRVLASKVEVGFVNALGATGVPMDFADVVPAIRNGTLDGTRIGIIVLVPSKFFTVAKYVYEDATGYVPTGMWVSKSWLNKLSADNRKAIYEAGEAVREKSQMFALGLIDRVPAVWRKNGGEWTRPTAADRAEMLRRARGVSDEILGGNANVKEMYELVKRAAEATRGDKPPMR